MLVTKIFSFANNVFFPSKVRTDYLSFIQFVVNMSSENVFNLVKAEILSFGKQMSYFIISSCAYFKLNFEFLNSLVWFGLCLCVRLVVMADRARKQDKTTESSAWFFSTVTRTLGSKSHPKDN